MTCWKTDINLSPLLAPSKRVDDKAELHQLDLLIPKRTFELYSPRWQWHLKTTLAQRHANFGTPGGQKAMKINLEEVIQRLGA